MKKLLFSLCSFIFFWAAAPALAAAGEIGSEPAGMSADDPCLQNTAEKGETGSRPGDFERLGAKGYEAIYNLDYKMAGELFRQMIAIAPARPAGYVYLANNLWLEALNRSRRLSSSLYSGNSFYVQAAESDKTDPQRDREFYALIRQAMAASTAMLQKDPKSIEGLYYQAAALGVRAGYIATVGRSFRRAIGDANDSIQIQRRVVKLEPDYFDAYLSIGLYEYVIDSLPFGWRFLARLAGLKGSKEKGIEHLEMVAERGKYTSDDARVLLIGIYGREHKLDSALKITDSLFARYPRNYLFGVERAAMLYRAGRKEEGERAFEGLLKDSRVAEEAFDLVNYQWGETMADSGDFAGALDRFNNVMRWGRSDPGLISLSHLHAGEALDRMGKHVEAVDHYQMVLKRENVFDSHERAGQYIKKPYNPASKS